MEISDNELLTAYKDTNNLKIINSVLKRYKRVISKNELKNCGLIGLWKTLKRYDSTKGQKFTTTLYDSVNWECIFNLKQNNKSKKFVPLLKQQTFVHNFNDIDLKELIDKLPNKYSEIIYRHFYNKETILEIAKSKNLSRETIRLRLKKALKHLADKCNLV